MFASIVDSMNQCFGIAFFSVLTLIMLFKRYAADNPEGAKKVGGVAAKGVVGLLSKFLK